MATPKLSDDVLRESVLALVTHGSQHKAAAALKMGQAAFNKRIKQARARGIPGAHHISVGSNKPATTSAEHERKIIAQADEITRLNRVIKDSHREANTAEIIREMVGGIVNTPIEPPDWLATIGTRPKGKPEAEVPVTIFSDPHIGEVVLKRATNGFNEYNMAIAEERVEKYFDKLIMLCRDHHTGHYPGLVLNMLGDNVSGGIHDELRKTDEEEVIPCVLKARDWLTAGIRRCADHFGRVYIPTACGNHGRLTHRPEFKKYHEKNWDFLIYKMLEKEFQDDKRVQFDLRPSNDVHYRVFNERYLACHGDMLGVKGGDGIIGSIGPVMRGEVKQAGQSSAMGMAFDKLIIGHWHQRLWLPRAIVNNAIKGFDEFAMKGLGAKPDRPTQALWFVHPAHGMTAHWDIYVSKSPKPATEWVSWSK